MSREFPIVNQEYYHIFNRGNDKRTTFIDRIDYQRAVYTIDYYRHKKLPERYSRIKTLNRFARELMNYDFNKSENKIVEVIAYCLMPNHYHLILKQIDDNGIPRFMSNFQNSYTKYFNTKHNRVGSIFQGTYKSVLIQSNEQLIYLSKYIHLNPLNAFLVKSEKLFDYKWSSLYEYIQPRHLSICDKTIILDQFKQDDSYKEFITDYLELREQIEIIQELTFDET